MENLICPRGAAARAPWCVMANMNQGNNLAGQQAQPPPPPQQQVYIVRQRNSGYATVSLVAGILGLLGLDACGAFAVAIVCGHLALSQIKRSGGAIGGHGQAVAGLVLGYFSVLLVAGVLLFFFGLAGIGARVEADQRQRDQRRESRQAEQARAAVGDLGQYAGDYDYGQYAIRVYAEGDTLKTSSPDTQCELRPLERDLFVFQRCTKQTSARLQFNRAGRGEIIGMTIRRYDLSNQFCKKLR